MNFCRKNEQKIIFTQQSEESRQINERNEEILKNLEDQV